MNTRTLGSRGLAPLAAILILAAAIASAEARMGGLGPIGQTQGTTGAGSMAGTGRQPHPQGYPAPPYSPNGPQRSQTSGLSGGGGTGSFTPGGGSGIKPIKKPNLQ